jgi:tetratricopeptide (TPR) repeat protein
MLWAAAMLCVAQVGGAGNAGARAEELWRRGERAEAIEVLQAAVKEAAGKPSAAAEKAGEKAATGLRLELARRLADVHRYEAALEHAQGAGPEGAALRGRLLFRLGRHAEALAELPENEADSLRLRVDVAEALGRFEESDRALEKLLAMAGRENPAAAALLARQAARRGEFELAAKEYERALGFDACNAAARFGLGQALLRLGQRERALEQLNEHRRLLPLLDQLDFAERAVDLAPNHASNVAAVGDAERALGRFDRAEAAYRRAAELAKPDEVVPIALRQARLAAEDRNDPRAAVEMLERAAKRVDDARLWVRAGDLMLSLGDRAGARTRFERALALRPQDEEIRKRFEATKAP